MVVNVNVQFNWNWNQLSDFNSGKNLRLFPEKLNRRGRLISVGSRYNIKRPEVTGLFLPNCLHRPTPDCDYIYHIVL